MFRHKPLMLAGVLTASAALAGTAAAECSEKTWKDCAGKPWVIGKPDTPIGEAWWPNKQWGADDEAGSTNCFTKPDVVKRGLRVMDTTAVTLCMDNNLPIVVFNLTKPGNLKKVLLGENIGTKVIGD